MELADLARTVKMQHRDHELTVRPLTAAEFVEINDRFAEITGTADDHLRAMMQFWADLLALVVVQPSAPADQWLQVPYDDLAEIGGQVLDVMNLSVTVKKKPLATGDGSPSTLPENSENLTSSDS